jgi:broad specificity phosphatase PhoE
MRVYLIRHGNAEHNVAFQKYGEAAYSDIQYRDAALTILGHTQTIEAEICIDASVDRVYCSPLRRCIQTARNMFGPYRCLYLDDGLLETRGPYPCNHRLTLGEICAQYKNINVVGVAEQEGDANRAEDEIDTVLKERAVSTYNAICKSAALAGCTSIAIVTHHDWLEALTGRSFKNAEVEVVFKDTN